jgi:ribulose-phosphate 3-epimerase
VHAEAGPHIHRTIQSIKALGKRAGLSLNPGTPATAIEGVLDALDLILVMTVNPGFGGQKFIESQLQKISDIRRRIDECGRVIDLEVDGGIDEATAQKVVDAGADVLVAGTASFKGGAACYFENISRLRVQA